MNILKNRPFSTDYHQGVGLVGFNLANSWVSVPAIKKMLNFALWSWGWNGRNTKISGKYVHIFNLTTLVTRINKVSESWESQNRMKINQIQCEFKEKLQPYHSVSNAKNVMETTYSCKCSCLKQYFKNWILVLHKIFSKLCDQWAKKKSEMNLFL